MEGALEQLLSLLPLLSAKTNDCSEPDAKAEPEPEPEIEPELYLSDLSTDKQKQLANLYQCSLSDLKEELTEPVGKLTLI